MGNESSAAPGLRLGTTVIYVDDAINDVKQTLDFYSAAFGFPIRFYDENLKFGELDAGTGGIMFASKEAGEFMAGSVFTEWCAERPTNVELALLTDDVQSAYERAVAAGAKSAQEPKTYSWGQTAAYVIGCDGTLVGILTPPPAST